MTLPEGTVALLAMATVPSVSPAPVIAVVAAACVIPTAFGTVACAGAELFELLQPAMAQTQTRMNALRCQTGLLLKLTTTPWPKIAPQTLGRPAPVSHGCVNRSFLRV
jgi:hypothetical protein